MPKFSRRTVILLSTAAALAGGAIAVTATASAGEFGMCPGFAEPTTPGVKVENVKLVKAMNGMCYYIGERVSPLTGKTISTSYSFTVKAK